MTGNALDCLAAGPMVTSRDAITGDLFFWEGHHVINVSLNNVQYIVYFIHVKCY